MTINYVDYAPEKFSENYVPLLPLTTYYVYKIVSPLQVSLLQVSTWMPILFGIGIIIFLYLWNPFASVFFILLPFSFDYFTTGYFSSELFGIFLTVSGFYFLSKDKKLPAIACIAVMSLAWQVFVIPFTLIAIFFALKKDFKHLAILIIMLLIMRQISFSLGLSYDPFLMFNEIFQGLKVTNASDWAGKVFDRVGTRPPELSEFTDGFTIPLLFLSSIGVLILIKKVRAFGSESLLILLWFISSLAAAILFDRFLLLLIAPICIASAVAVKELYNKESLIIKNLKKFKP